MVRATVVVGAHYLIQLAAMLHDDDFVTNGAYGVQVMADEEVGNIEFAPQFGHQVEYGSADYGVECRSDFVAQYQIRFGGQRTGQIDALFLAARQASRQTFGNAMWQFDQIQQLLNASLQRYPVQALIKLEWSRQNVFYGVRRIECGIGNLEHHLNLSQLFLAALRQPRFEFSAIEQHGAMTRRKQTCNSPCQGTFSGAGFTNDADGLTGIEFQIDVLQYQLGRLATGIERAIANRYLMQIK